MTGAAIIRREAGGTIFLTVHGAFDGASAWALRVAMEESSATEFVINGQTYNISGVPVRTSRLKPVSPADLAPGTMVDLHFHGGKLTSVYVYPNLVN